MTDIKTTFLKDYTPPNFLIKHAELTFWLDDALTRVKTCLTFNRVSAPKNKKQPLVLHGENCELIAIKRDGQRLSDREYQLKDNELIIFNFIGT